MQGVKKEVIEIIANVTGYETHEVTPETTNNDLGLDSLDKIDIVVAIEGKFGIGIPDERFEDLKTVQDWVDMTEKIIQESK